MLYNDYIPKMCAGMQKNAYQHKSNHQIYIFWNRINEIMKKSRIIDIKSNNENKLFSMLRF